MKIQTHVIACLVALFFATNLFANTQSSLVPIDPKIRYGKLDNGLTYYIRANKEPKQRAEFYFAQNVGAILENDDQNGLAHFLEHMAFNGTKHFPKKGIIDYFEKIGVKFGRNINAYTALDETVYNLSDVPTIRQGIIDSALLVLHDWASYISLEGEEIDAERGVIREEWRTGAGPERRMWKQSNLLKYPDSQYAKRDIIGDTAIINNFSHKSLRDFYHQWYRPDLQAIIIVGDIDVDTIEQKIKHLFSQLPKSQNPPERIIYSIPNNVEPIIVIVKDKEARLTRIELEYKHDLVDEKERYSVRTYFKGLMNSLISHMIGGRFNEITQKADASIIQGMGYYGKLAKGKDAFQLIAIPVDGKEQEGVIALLTEVEKIKRFGFKLSELERAKSNLIASFKATYNERENIKNNSLAREYVRNFTSQEVIPGIEWEYEFAIKMVPEISIDSVNRLVQSYITDENLILCITGPDKESIKIPSSQALLDIITTVKMSDILNNDDEDHLKELIQNEPKAKIRIKKASTTKKFQAQEWVLKNGIKIIFKPTTFKTDEIILNAFSRGGYSQLNSSEDLFSAVLTSSIISNNGLGTHSALTLEKLLTGKNVSLSPFINEYQEGFSGNSSVEDFKTLLQLLYLHFQAPRRDDNAYQSLVNKYRTSLVNVSNDPRKAFSDSINSTLTNHHPRTVIMNLENLEKLSQEKALEIYTQRFSNPADFTFIFTGNINPKDRNIKQMIGQYLGSLQTNKNMDTIIDHGIRKPTGQVVVKFTKEMQIKKASNYIHYNGAIPYTLQNRITINAIASLLNMRYLETIREKECGSYGVAVRSSLTKYPFAEASLSMRFDTDPEKQERLMRIIHHEVQEILENGPRADDLQKVKENMLKQLEEDARSNQWWTNVLIHYYRDGIDCANQSKACILSLNHEIVQHTLKELVAQENTIEIVMMPTE